MTTIIIPSVKVENLKPCLESIEKYTTLGEDVNVLVVANGMKPEARDFLETKWEYLWNDEMLGYPKAVNKGILACGDDDVILLNDDVVLLPQAKDTWIKMLQEPFKGYGLKYSNDENWTKNDVGISGPIASQDSFAVFFCVYISRACLNKVGLLDEAFSQGGGEDTDFCIRAKQEGFKIVQVPALEPLKSEKGICIGSFPIYHKGEATVHDSDYVKGWVEHLNKNCDYLSKKYPDMTPIWHKFPIKLNLACGPKSHHLPGFINIDQYEEGADLALDVRDLSRWKDGEVDEIYAGHIVEHFDPYKIQGILKEWARVMKKGGKLAMELPDIYEVCKAFVESIDKKDNRHWEHLTAIYGAIENVKVPHLYGWTFEMMAGLLQSVGFTGMVKSEQQVYHQSKNMRVTCWKG